MGVMHGSVLCINAVFSFEPGIIAKPQFACKPALGALVCLDDPSRPGGSKSRDHYEK